MSTPGVPPPTTPPYLLRTPRLILRCLAPDDAVRRKEAVDSSGVHLENFFSHASGWPIPLSTHAAIVRKQRGQFDLDQDRGYGVFEPETGRMLGETGLLKRAGLEALELFYWLRHDALGQGIATEMASAMVKTAFEFDQVKRMDVMCDPENERSAAMARRLGFTFEGRLRDRRLAPHHERKDLLCFTLLASEYPHTSARQLSLQYFDFLGHPLP
ncbi:GNAT family N-acetyltransferase [Stigmatella sp. ncwal1]|uniref:GNAT family N-acetyltransferase n=1 Tax=Stigmatella ashevillensis TaxID=2995309 RepID=A0ABT5D7V2_9BACT|nr:GNAT family N-acetyltransferase [Stigmatella ashevillena]MDC0709735.1 GNAT family N-acetyltransferase [Stigmatella ashevillena]